MNRIDPLPWASMCGKAYLHARTPPSTLTRMQLWNSSVLKLMKSISRVVAGFRYTALLNSTSIRPKVWTVCSTISRRASSWPTSTCNARALTPISAATACADSAKRSVTTTVAPSIPKRSAEARPMPLPAPVITQTLPSRRFRISLIKMSRERRKKSAFEANAEKGARCQRV
ncbi:hypothetical protein D3C78_1306200 [compost metagenome]